MVPRILIPAILSLAFVVPAMAATSPPSQSSSTQGTSNTQNNDQANAPKIAARLQQSLSKAGFTDVHVMPESFLVRAKDRDGNPVMMVINPDSITSVTAMGASPNGSSNGSVGAGSSTSSTQTTKE